jgi:hypothetical protein
MRMDIRPNDDDEIIAEVRRNRKAYCARFGNDWDLIHEHLKRLDAENPDNVVSFSRGPQFATLTDVACGAKI